MFDHKYLYSSEVSDTGMISLIFNAHILHDTCFIVYHYTHSNQKIFADSLV